MVFEKTLNPKFQDLSQKLLYLFNSRGTPTGQKLKSVKLLRVLRPLKAINRIPKLKVSNRELKG